MLTLDKCTIDLLRSIHLPINNGNSDDDDGKKNGSIPLRQVQKLEHAPVTAALVTPTIATLIRHTNNDGLHGTIDEKDCLCAGLSPKPCVKTTDTHQPAREDSGAQNSNGVNSDETKETGSGEEEQIREEDVAVKTTPNIETDSVAPHSVSEMEGIRNVTTTTIANAAMDFKSKDAVVFTDDTEATIAITIQNDDSIIGTSVNEAQHRQEQQCQPVSFLPGTRWVASLASASDDIEWDNLGIPRRQQAFWKCITRAAMVALVFFWSIPVAFLSSLEKLASVPGIGPAFEPLLSLPPMVSKLIRPKNKNNNNLPFCFVLCFVICFVFCACRYWPS